MTYQEYLCCLSQFPDPPPRVDTSLKLDSAQIRNVYERHALYRIEAYKRPDNSFIAQWGPVSTRAAYQALKIAFGFSKIYGELAYTGYYELVDSITFDVSWYKELDGVHFEIWKPVAKQKVPEDKAQELIAVAIEKPKWYEQYVKRKIQIARDIGLIPMPTISGPISG
ncbi:hypothetical protein E2562_005629 [Oryza meyeriana var. granulata]|uniref:Uncharacterized protein n=1 Tax=Oryza meyeriana var. granulata TaxID=110450 RepID=A0A6G1BJJ1_9ORYZ|nr:hypothetical protein E2562_005629 [Oryza meyeriana var. granulata]